MSSQAGPGSDYYEEHRKIQELLPRYLEVLLRGDDVAAMYPAIASHLESCEECRAILMDVLACWGDEVQEEGQATVNDLPFLHPEQVYHLIRPGSTVASFSIHIVLTGAFLQARSPVAPDRPARRGFGPIQPGGRLLLYDTLIVGGEPIQVMLMLHNGSAPDLYRVTGELSAVLLPPNLWARLQVGERTYYTRVQDEKLEFEDVAFGDVPERIVLTLEVRE